MNGSNARYSSGDMPIRKPRGIATSAASPKPSITRPIEYAIWMPMPWSLVPRT